MNAKSLTHTKTHTHIHTHFPVLIYTFLSLPTQITHWKIRFLNISHDMFCTRTFAIRIISNTLDYKKYIILREVNQVFWHSKRITGQASYSDLRKNILVTLHKLTYEVDKCNEWFMTTINQVRMSHSGSDTNSLKGRGDRVSVHTHTDTYNAVESSTNQPTNTPDCGTRSHGKIHWQNLIVGLVRQVPTFQPPYWIPANVPLF